MSVDAERMIAVALESFLRPARRADREAGARPQARHRLGGVGAVALGMALGAGARAAVKRVRKLDLTRAAGAVEERLKR
jgi:hypothetical protein